MTTAYNGDDVGEQKIPRFQLYLHKHVTRHFILFETYPNILLLQHQNLQTEDRENLA